MDFQRCFRETCDRASAQLAMFADQVGSNIPGATETTKAMLEKAAELQNMCGYRGRVHIIYEAVSTVVAKPENDPAPPASLLHQPLMCILFSPTVILQGDNRIVPASQLVGALSSFSFISGVVSNSPTAPDTPVQTAPPAKPPPVPPPKWYPGKRVDLSLPVSEEALCVSEDSFALFRGFSMNLTHKAYRTFFHKMYARIKDARNGNIPGPMSYERFSPPWIRRKIIVGDNKFVTFGDPLVPDLHRMRSAAGTRRLKVLLAAFHEREPMARQIIDELIPGFHREREEELARSEATAAAALQATRAAQASLTHTAAPGGGADPGQIRPDDASTVMGAHQPHSSMQALSTSQAQVAHQQTGNTVDTNSIATPPSPGIAFATRNRVLPPDAIAVGQGQALPAGATMVRPTTGTIARSASARGSRVDASSVTGHKRLRTTPGHPVLGAQPAAQRRARSSNDGRGLADMTANELVASGSVNSAGSLVPRADHIDLGSALDTAGPPDGS